MVRVICVAVLGGLDDRADLDRRINGFHLRIIIREAHGVGPGIVRLEGRVGVVVGFPGAIDFVSDLPVFKIAVIGDIEHPHGVGGFLGRAGAVVHDDESLGMRIGGEGDEIRGK